MNKDYLVDVDRAKEAHKAMTVGSTTNAASSASKPVVGTSGYLVVTTVDVTYLSIDPVIDAAASAPAKSGNKLKDKDYDHGYGKHEMSVIVTTGTLSPAAGATTRHLGAIKTHCVTRGEIS